MQLADSYVYRLKHLLPVGRGASMRVKEEGSEAPEQVYVAEAPLHGLAVGADALYFSTETGRVLKIPRPAERPLK